MKKIFELGQKIKDIRKQQNMNASDVAKLIGMSPAYYSQIENGKVKPTKDKLQKIMDIYNIPDEDRRLLESLAGQTTSSHSEEPVNSERTPEKSVFEVKIDPSRSPILFSDIMFITLTDNGIVFDFGQKITSTNNIDIVSRIGVSEKHAEKIHRLLGDQLKKVQRSIENEK